MSRKSLNKFSDEITSGLRPDLEGDKVPLWADGGNVVFEDGGVRPSLGRYSIAKKLQGLPPSGLIETIIGGKNTLFWGTADPDGVNGKLFMWQEGDSSATDVTRVSGGDYTGTGIWSLTPWGQWVIATNGVDEPQLFGHSSDPDDFQNMYAVSGVSGMVGATTWDLVKQNGPFLFGFGTNVNPQSFMWCDEDNALIWDPLPGNFAGDLPVRDLFSNIMAVGQLNVGVAIYGRDQMHYTEYIGGQLVHSIRRIQNNVGAFGKQCISTVGPYNFGFGPRGFFRTDGTQTEYIDNDHIHDFVFGRLDRDNAYKAVSWVNVGAFTIFWSFPETGFGGENSITVGFNWKTRGWTIIDAGSNSATSGGVFDTPYHLGYAGAVMKESDEITSVPGDPLLMSAEVALYGLGYGESGYGEMGYGGIWTGDG